MLFNPRDVHVAVGSGDVSFEIAQRLLLPLVLLHPLFLVSFQQSLCSIIQLLNGYLYSTASICAFVLFV